MANLVLNNKNLKLQLSVTAINLTSAMIQLYASVTRNLELEERREEAAYYESLVSAYSEGNPESELLSELFMDVSNEADKLREELKGNFYE